ncbi:MAG: hypothetical protein GY704_17365, partial [Phycisphaeraceae bacterium]|nr:hypothetical protein [Phycisphaeraceae bacterium]
MSARTVALLLVAGLVVVAASTLAGGPPQEEGTAAEVLLSAPDREWVRVFEDGQSGAVHRFRPDGKLEILPPTKTSWRTWKIKDGRLLINGKMPCDIETTTVIRGEHTKGRFVLVPKAEASKPPTVKRTPRLTIRIFVDGSDTIYARGDRLWLIHESALRPGTQGGAGPTYVNGKAWNPVWKGRDTEPIENLDPPLPTAGEHLYWIAKAKGRGTIRVN